MQHVPGTVTRKWAAIATDFEFVMTMLREVLHNKKRYLPMLARRDARSRAQPCRHSVARSPPTTDDQ